MFTWVPTHKEIAQKLLQFEDRQLELIQILKDAGETIINDEDLDGNKFEMTEIDPFTFFCYIYKYGTQKRLAQLQKVAAAFNISPLPEDEHGIPSANAQKVWLFPYKKIRINNEIKRLWDFFKAAMNDQLTAEHFDDIIKINSTGKTKITEGLFYINPEKYLPINAQTRPYLEEVMGIDPSFKSWPEYLKILHRVTSHTQDAFFKISYDAWLWNTSRTESPDKEQNTILPGKDLFPVQEFILIETLSQINNPKAINMLYEKFDHLHEITGIKPDQVHGSIRSDKRIPITIGRRYVLMLKRKGESIIWGMILKAEDEELASSHPCFDNSGFFSDKDGGKNYIWTEFVCPASTADPDFGPIWEKWKEAVADYFNEIKKTRLFETFKRFTNEAVIKSLFDKPYRQLVIGKSKTYAEYPVQQQIIEKYKSILKVTGIEDESYKWEILGKPIWNLDDPNLTAMIKKVPFKNLIYPMAIAVVIKLSEAYPEQLKAILKRFFNENENLADRVKTFRSEIDSLYKNIEADLASHHDERTAATYLAFYDANTYPLYKNSFYAKYCKLIGKRQATTNEKYQHYNELINELIENHIRKDHDLLTIYAKVKPSDGFKDKNYLLLAQDMLYRTLDGSFEELTTAKTYSKPTDNHPNDGLTIVEYKQKDLPDEIISEPQGATNFWWLNANPVMWSISKWEVEDVQTYTARNQRGNKRRIYKHFQAVQPGDLMIGYETSPVKQIKALFEITKGLHPTKSQGEVIEFKMTEKLNVPVDWNALQNNPALADCEVFKNNQGSLFKLSEEEFDVIRELIDDKNIEVIVMGPDKPTVYTYETDPDKPFIPSEEFKQATELLRRKKNIILQGPPGVGKTFIARKLAYELIGQKSDLNIEMVQFHQSFSYEDFIQGLRPGKTGFELKNGIFYSFCKKAHAHPGRMFFFVIDEINRGNLSKIFGEVMMLIEPDKRHEKYALKLTYSEDEHDRFYIPDNVYVIGTMNTADRSLAIVDYALRRRFAFITLQPQYGKAFKNFLLSRGVSEGVVEHIVNSIEKVNWKIKDDVNLGTGFQIGHSYFCTYPSGSNETDWFNQVINFEIKPLLEEIWFDNTDQAKTLVKELLL
jgi:hypothetical protein